MGDFQAASKAHLASNAYQLLPAKHKKRMQDALEMQWAGGSVPPTHTQKQFLGEGSGLFSQCCVASNSVRKAYLVLE